MTTPTTTTAQAALGTDRTGTAADTVLTRCVCLMLSCSKLGNRRMVDTDDVDIDDPATGETMDVNKDALAMSKKLIDPRRLRAINSLFSAVKYYMAGVATRSHRIFGPGTYLVPSALVDEVDARLTQFQVDIAAAADLVAKEWPESIARSRVALGKLFNESDYLTADQVRRRFSLDWTYPSFQSANLEEISPALARREQQKHHDRLASAFDEIVLDLRASALKVMRELAERLAPGPDGKPKSLFGTALDDLKSYVALLPKRNISGDDELDDVIAHTAAYVEGVDVETLRNAPAVRRQLQQLAEQAAGKLEGLVVTTRRAISFDGPSV